jgi:hypothetical protein
MKKITLCAALCYMALESLLPNKLFCQQLDTPESYTKEILLKPYLTEIIENNNLRKAVKQLDELNSKMTVDGWVLFQMIEFIDSGNFKGFIVTYKKAEEKDSYKQ